MEVKGTKILITGTNRGIGKAVATVLAENGAHLYLANRTFDPNQEAELKNLGAASVKSYQLDLTSFDNIEKFISETKAEEIDILFNNAGLLTGGLIEEQPIADIYKMFQVNINALVHLTHGFVGGMVNRGRGKIINHASVSAFMHSPCASTYCAAKAAVVAFTNCIRAELRGTGVTTLTLITPGINTDMFNDIPNKYSKNLDVSSLGKGMSPKLYAKMIHEAILMDLETLEPKGGTGVGVFIAKHSPKIYEKLVLTKFHR